MAAVLHSWLKKKWDRREVKYLSELPGGVKELLMERVRRILASTTNNKSTPPADEDEDGNRNYYTTEDIRTHWGHKALEGAKKLFEGRRRPSKNRKDDDPESLLFGREFEEDVLVWHMATCVFLALINRAKIKRPR